MDAGKGPFGVTGDQVALLGQLAGIVLEVRRANQRLAVPPVALAFALLGQRFECRQLLALSVVESHVAVLRDVAKLIDSLDHVA